MISASRRSVLGTGVALAMPAISHATDNSVEISVYFPVAVGGPITQIIDSYAVAFQRQNPSIKVTPGFPAAAVALDQLQYAVAERSTHDNQRVSQALNDGLRAALLGRKPPRCGAQRGTDHSDAASASVQSLTCKTGGLSL